MKYILKGCFSAKGFEKIKDGDEVPVGWFDEITMEKMIKKGTIVVQNEQSKQKEIIEEIENEIESESKDEIFENKKKGVRRK
jgi:MinD-like ATPase involved in chromosome partitioning or flagellar assembly